MTTADTTKPQDRRAPQSAGGKPRRLRKLIFWLHLISGLIAGVVIAIMSVTGIAIAFEEEILGWYDRDVSRIESAPAAGAEPLAVEVLRQRVESEFPDFQVTAVSVPRDSGLAWEFRAGRKGMMYVDPYTGEARASRAGEAHRVLHGIEDWHRWLGAKDGATSTARLVTGIANLMFVVLCVSGLYLWFPRRWSRRALRPILGLVLRYKGKARDFNWHNVFGFWSLPVLLVLTVTAVVISFDWAHRAVFVLAGEEPPKSRNYGMMAVAPPVVAAPPEGTPRLPLDEVFERVADALPEWESIALQFPAAAGPDGGPVEALDLGVTVPDSMPSRGFIPVRADPFTGEVLQVVCFDDRSPGLRARVWVRFLHTGAAFGLPGKIVATLATAASLVLVWTGFALSWRRFFGKRK